MVPLRHLAILALLLLLGFAGGCATTGDGSGGGSRDTLTREQLADFPNSNLFRVVRQLRPNWLRHRGGPPGVLVDGLRRGDVSVLRTILTQDVSTVEFLSPSQATNRFGSGFLHGAIAVTSG